MTHQTLIIKIPPELHRRLAALATEGILGRTLEEVVIHLIRNALHRDWVPRPVSPEKKIPPDLRVGLDGAAKRTDPMPDLGYPPGQRLLRLPEVAQMVGLSKSTIYAMVNISTFPAPKRLGARSVAWLQSEVASWVLARHQAS